MSASEVRFATGEPPAPAPKPAEGTVGADGTLQLNAPTPAPDPTPAPVERPAWLPEKFKTPEDLAKSYLELEKKGATPKPADTPAPKAGTPIPFDKLTEEYAKSGAVSEETLTALEAQGLPRKMVTDYIRGQEALAAKQRSDLASVVQGEENLTAVMEWAAKSLTPAEIAGYNALIDAGNIDSAKILLATFGEKYLLANGSDPKSVTTGANTGAGGNVGGYGSAAEMVADMRLPKYQNDPAFRGMVKSRVAKSNF